MSTLLDDIPTRRSTSPTQRLRTTMAAVRVSISWFGTRKTLTAEQKSQAAESFGAEGTFLSAGKKLLDTSHPAFKAVTSVRNRVISYWKGVSLPFPEPGIRLIRQDDIQAFDVQLNSLKAELEEAVWRLDEHYAELKSAARDRLGSLFNAGDYPDSLQGLFKVEWDFPSVEPPNYLRELSPELFLTGNSLRQMRNQLGQFGRESFLGHSHRFVEPGGDAGRWMGCWSTVRGETSSAGRPSRPG